MKFSDRVNLEALRRAPEELDAALLEAARAILADSNRRVPYDTGDLMRSGKVVPVEPGKVAVTYTDGGAVAAHEKMNVPPGNGRERKYLENAFNSRRQETLNILSAAGRRVLGL